MPFSDLQHFMAVLERRGELRRIRVEVDPELEITEIATRVVKDEGPALLFERVKGSDFPLLINVLGSPGRIELALGRHPQGVGEELIGLLERANPPSLKALWQSRGTVRRVLAGRLKPVRRGISQQVVEAPDLSTLPVVKCWPQDAGKFITFPLVITHRPADGRSNMGVYRMQLHDNVSTGMHWQLQKGGGFHYQEAEAQGRPLEVAACLGGDPVLLLAAVLPLPESLEELVFAGILRGKPTPMVRAKSLDMRVPANAEFVLEGRVEPGERLPEGPFGDHLGHYSDESPFPVFRIQTVTRRKHPVYLAAVVGKPPQEDRYLGDAAQQFLNPFVKLIQPEVEDMWAYYEAGFHNLVVVSVRSRYAKEPMKTALGLFGNGQLSLTKCIVLVGSGVDPRDFDAVLGEIQRHYRSESDFLLLPKVPLDTLDFTSFQMHLGSKMAIDATPKQDRPPDRPDRPMTADLSRLAPEAKGWRLVRETLLAVTVATEDARSVLTRLCRDDGLAGVKLIAAVSPDVDLDDRTSLLWGIFTRFDPARDVIFREMRMEGAAPVYRGPLGIDATFKPGYPATLEMDAETVAKVDRRWNDYWQGEG